MSAVNLLIKLMLPGNQQEIVALPGILEFFYHTRSVRWRHYDYIKVSVDNIV